MQNGPIIEFKTQEELNASLAEWQERLFLQDWIIKANLIPLHEMSTIGNVGENEYQTTNKASVITIGALTEDAKSRICKSPQELTLVHELLHLKFIMTDDAQNTVDGCFMGAYEHALIEQMAKSLIMAKYNLKFDWFRNF